MQNFSPELIFSTAILIAIYYSLALLFIYVFRGILWWFSGAFYLVDEFMWFLYNPLRVFMRANKKQREGVKGKVTRGSFLIFTTFLIAPAYKLAIYFLTTPLRLITAIYFDVIMYLFVMASDTIEELFNPKLGAMRFKKGFKYFALWIVLFPYRLFWFFVKNILALVDSMMMVIISLAWPTFTMFHGTSHEAVTSIERAGRWMVGRGNFAGSGIYFGRSIKTAKLYAGTKAFVNNDGQTMFPIIMARVTLSALRNITTLKEDDRKKVADFSGQGGRELAQRIKFPYFATEFWRTDNGWWEYCLIRGGEDGKLVKSWRIRPVGYAHVKPENSYSGSLQRLWGGKAHYCLSFTNIAMAAISVVIVLALNYGHAELFGYGGFLSFIGFRI